MSDVTGFTPRGAVMRQKAVRSLFQGVHAGDADAAMDMKREALRLLALGEDEERLNDAIDALDETVWNDLELSLFGNGERV